MKTPVKLKQITLSGYKSYGVPVQVDLRDVNVIIGANGAGNQSGRTNREFHDIIPWNRTWLLRNRKISTIVRKQRHPSAC